MDIIPIWLYHKDNPNNRISVYALLDNASNGTFIKEDSLRKRGVEGVESKLLLTTMHGTQEIDIKAVDGLMASHFQENEVSLALPRTYVRRQIPADRDEIPFPRKNESRELKQTTTTTATATSPSKRFNEQNNSCARARVL